MQYYLQIGERIIEVVGGTGLFCLGNPAANGDGAQPETAFYLGKANVRAAPVVGAIAVKVAVKQSLCGCALNGILLRARIGLKVNKHAF